MMMMHYTIPNVNAVGLADASIGDDDIATDVRGVCERALEQPHLIVPRPHIAADKLGAVFRQWSRFVRKGRRKGGGTGVPSLLPDVVACLPWPCGFQLAASVLVDVAKGDEGAVRGSWG